MPKPQPWSEQEQRDTVKSYFDMLAKEQAGMKYNKAQYRKELLTKLNNRSAGSVEFKYQNISAVLVQLGLPRINGYKPMDNVQKSLKDAVLAELDSIDWIIQQTKTA